MSENGSRWYFPVFEGLFDAKHVAQMGPAVWLYGWILSRAYAANNHGVVAYSHTDPVRDLGVCEKTVRLWFERLQKHGYLIIRARRPHSLDVEVSRWHSVEEWLKAKAEAGPVNLYQSQSATTVNPYHSEVENGKVIGNVVGKDLPSHISIRLLGYYSYPSGVPDGYEASDARPNLSEAFHELLTVLQTAKNKAAVLRAIYGLCFPGELPEYSYLGKVAKAVGGAGRLAEVMWSLTVKPPTGDVLAYILAMHKKAESNPPRRETTLDRSKRVLDAIIAGGSNGDGRNGGEGAAPVGGELAGSRGDARNGKALPTGPGRGAR